MFWFPEKPQRIYDINRVPDSYTAEVKKDGHRVIVTDINGKFEMLSREGTPLTAIKQPDKWQPIFERIFGSGYYLDGELVGPRQAGIKADTIILWDMLYDDGELLNKYTYFMRHSRLVSVFNNNTVLYEFVPNTEKPCSKDILDKFIGTVSVKIDELYLGVSVRYQKKDVERILGLMDPLYNEGLVFKNVKSPLNWSIKATTHSANQLKFKIRE